MATKTKSKRGGKVEVINYKNRPLEKNVIIKCLDCGKKGLLGNKYHMERESVIHESTRELTGSLFYLREDTQVCNYTNEAKKEYCFALRKVLEHAYPVKDYQSDLRTSIAKEYYKGSSTKDAVLNVMKPRRDKLVQTVERCQATIEKIDDTFADVGVKFYEY